MNEPPAEPVAASVESTDPRVGPPINDRLLALLPLLGEWHGEGIGAKPDDGATFGYRQWVRFAHDGRPFLSYQSRTVLVDEHGTALRPAWRESGFWRPGTGQDDLEVVLAAGAGQAMIFSGRAGDNTWDLASTLLAPTPTAVAVVAERRLYALREGQLRYASELALPGRAFIPHLNAALDRTAPDRT